MTKKRGFTLIELLVVIAIIALLLAILLPSLAKVKKISRRVICATNVRSLGQAFHSYAAENQDRVVQVISMENANLWPYAMKDYYETNDLLLCPEANNTTDKRYKPYRAYRRMGFYNRKWKQGTPDRAWEEINHDNTEIIGSYGTNAWVHYPHFSTVPYIGNLDEELIWGGRISDGNSEVPLLLDCVSTSGLPLYIRPLDAGEPPTRDELDIWDRGLSVEIERLLRTRGEMSRFCFDRHDKLINTVFMDGSTRPVKVEDLWLLRWTRDFPKKTVTIEW